MQSAARGPPRICVAVLNAQRMLLSVRAQSASSLVVWSSLVPPIPLLIASYMFEGGWHVVHTIASASWLMWACALFLAYAATLFGFASWARLLHRYPTALIARSHC